jgi:hypothetical protein
MAPPSQRAGPTFVTQHSPGGRTRVVEGSQQPAPSSLKAPDKSTTDLYAGKAEYGRSAAAFSAEERERLRRARDVALGIAPPAEAVSAAVGAPAMQAPQSSPRGGGRRGGGAAGGVAVRRGGAPRGASGSATGKAASASTSGRTAKAHHSADKAAPQRCVSAARPRAACARTPIRSDVDTRSSHRRRSAKGGSSPRSDAPAAPLPQPSDEAVPLPPLSPPSSQEGYTSGDICDAAPLPAASSTMGLAQAKAFPDHDGTFSLFSSGSPAEWAFRAPLPSMAHEGTPLPPYVPWGAAAPASETAAGSGWWSPALWMPRDSGSGSGGDDACGAPSEAPPPFAARLPPASGGLWDPPPRSSSSSSGSSSAAARVTSASAHATRSPPPQLFSPPPPPPPQPYMQHMPPRRAIAGVDVEAARAAARAALAPRPLQPAAPAAVIAGGIRRVSASSVLPLGALSLAGRATPPLPAPFSPHADDDGDIDAILRGLSAAD